MPQSLKLYKWTWPHNKGMNDWLALVMSGADCRLAAVLLCFALFVSHSSMEMV